MFGPAVVTAAGGVTPPAFGLLQRRNLGFQDWRFGFSSASARLCRGRRSRWTPPQHPLFSMISPWRIAMRRCVMAGLERGRQAERRFSSMTFRRLALSPGCDLTPTAMLFQPPRRTADPNRSIGTRSGAMVKSAGLLVARAHGRGRAVTVSAARGYLLGTCLQRPGW